MMKYIFHAKRGLPTVDQRITCHNFLPNLSFLQIGLQLSSTKAWKVSVSSYSSTKILEDRILDMRIDKK